MKHELRLFSFDGGGTRSVRDVAPTRATASGACPQCRAEPFYVAGSGLRVVDDRRYEADGVCLACMAHVGTIVATPSTLFGIAEDEAVLTHGRARVYP